MSSNFVRTSHLVVRGGQVLPRTPTPPSQRTNYKYVPYEPLNRPAPEDYFRETVNRFQQENQMLRRELREKSQVGSSQPTVSQTSAQDFKLKLEIAQLQNSLSKMQAELAHKDELLAQKDERIRELTKDNIRLREDIQSFLQELDSLHDVLLRKDDEIESKNQAIRAYCKTIEELARRDHQEYKSTHPSEHYLNTPRIQEKDQEYEEQEEEEKIKQDQDAVQVFQEKKPSSFQEQFSIKHKRFLTPEHHTFKSQQGEIEEDYNDIKKILKTQDEEDKSMTPLGSPSARGCFSSQDEKRLLSHSSSNDSFNNLSENLNTWSEWASGGKSGQFMTLDLLAETPDPLAGGFLSLFKRD